MKKIYKISSVSDVITNSSSEVFVPKIDDKFKEIIKDLKFMKFYLFETKEDVKDFVLKSITPDEKGYYDNCMLSYLFETGFLNFIYEDSYSFSEFLDYCYDKLNKTPQEIYDFLSPVFEPLIGHAYDIIEDDCCGACGYNDINMLNSIGIKCIDRI